MVVCGEFRSTCARAEGKNCHADVIRSDGERSAVHWLADTGKSVRLPGCSRQMPEPCSLTSVDTESDLCSQHFMYTNQHIGSCVGLPNYTTLVRQRAASLSCQVAGSNCRGRSEFRMQAALVTTVGGAVCAGCDSSGEAARCGVDLHKARSHWASARILTGSQFERSENSGGRMIALPSNLGTGFADAPIERPRFTDEALGGSCM